ncbi:GumC family protein [Lichenibacterium dinghuense]|uniref:GumC family protein n=1 Tax=Lichenibacterium dinghuense TaxID=2895977 RepID=UPI001F1EC89E|nr:exopolysaccharide transport family protein [Lichenibacterium sp. 6Y81]
MSVAEFEPRPSGWPHAAPGPQQPAGSVIDLRGLVHILRRRRKLIVGAALVLGLVAACVAATLSPRYVASTKIIFDPRPIAVLQSDLQAQVQGGEEASAEVESQLQVITSTEVLTPVIRRLDLEHDPDFGAPPASAIGSLTRDIRGLFGSRAPEAGDAAAALALRRLQADITVDRLDKTFILEIKVQTSSAEKSAAIANAVASSFLAVTVENRASEVRRSGEGLSAKLDELRNRLARSEEAVEEFRTKHDLVGPNGKPNIEQQIADVSAQLSAARARNAEQEARVDVVDRDLKTGVPLATLSEANTSSTLTALKAQLTAAQREASEAELTYGPRHPLRVAAVAQLKAAREHVRRETELLAGTARSDSARAKRSVDIMARHLDALKAMEAAANDDLVRLREREREAASDRSVYETFLNRAKELQQRQSLDTLDARVLTPAVVPSAGSGPSRIGLALGGVVLGGLLGMGGALVREQFDDTVRSPQQIAAETDVPILAVVRNASDADDPGLSALRGALDARAANRQVRHVLLAALGSAGTCGLVACNLARTAEHELLGTILADADDDGRGLTRMLEDGAAGPGPRGSASAGLHGEDLRVLDGIPFVPARSVAQGYASDPNRIRKTLGGLVRNTRMVLVYASAGRAAGRIRSLAAAVDDALLVIEAGHASGEELRTTLRLLQAGGPKLRGIVLVGDFESV